VTGAERMSAARTAPCGPEPRMVWMSSPRSAASRRALGDAALRRTAALLGAPLTWPAVFSWPAGAAAAVVRASTYARTSAFSILPVLVFTWTRSTPCCSAIFRARGDALIAAAGEATEAGATRDTPASPGAPIWAMAWPTGITSPSCALTCIRMPETGASISVVTLSVSISRSGSPLTTASPGALSQRMTLPVSCASSSAGMMTDVAIRLSCRGPWPRRRRLSRSAPSDPRGRAKTVSARPWRRCA
jgi:hypothetical protein